MSDDFLASLDSYKLQLTQVEAALTSDPTNEELLKLQTDLTEVIGLTKELLAQTQEPDSPPPQSHSAGSGPSSSSTTRTSYDRTSGGKRKAEEWKVGDKCLAPWSQDGKYYEAVIEEIQPGGLQVSIGFSSYAHGDVCNISQLRALGSGVIDKKSKGGASSLTSGSSGTPAGSSSTGPSTARRVGPKETLAERKAALLKQKEYLKKRKQKKLARVQEQEQEREKDKKKWINFSTKKGLMKGKKSIFASPETVDGRVGVGTCGVAGKGMTEFSAADKWKRGWKK